MSVWVRGVAIATALVTAGVTGAAPAGASLPKHATRVTVHAGHTVSNVDASLTEGSAIAGQVTDTDSNPLYGAQVEVLTASGQVVDYTFTDDNGDYRAVGLPPTTKGYAVCVGGQTASSSTRPVGYGYAAQCNGSMKSWPVGSKPPSDARLIPTVVGQASTANLILNDGGGITGQVVARATGHKVDGTGVLFSVSDHNESTFSVTEGSYTVNGLTPGDSYKVCFVAQTDSSKARPGLVPECYRDTSWRAYSGAPSTAKKITVTAGAAAEADQSLPNAAAVTGKVRNARTHSAISNAAVVAFAHGKVLAAQSPDKHGSYYLPGLPAETVDVCALPDDHRLVLRAARAERRTSHRVFSMRAGTFALGSAAEGTGQCWKHTPWSGKGSIPHAARELHLHHGATTSGIDLAVTPTTFHSHITGRIRDAAGGLEHASVSAFRPNGSLVSYTTSGKGGAYRLGVPASAKKGYLVCAEPARDVFAPRSDAHGDSRRAAVGSRCWRKASWNGAGEPPKDAPKVTVAPGHTRTGIDVTLPKAGTITGTVTYRTAPVTNLSVTVFDARGDYVGYASTDTEGRYKIVGLSPAKGYLVCFSAEYTDVSTLDPDYGLRPQCYSGQAWDGLND